MDKDNNFEFSWNFHHDFDNKSYVQELKNMNLEKQLEIAKRCISDLRNLGFHNEIVKVCADNAIKDIENTKNEKVNLFRLKGYGWKG